MKKNFLLTILALSFAFALFAPDTAQAAEDITWPGNGQMRFIPDPRTFIVPRPWLPGKQPRIVQSPHIHNHLLIAPYAPSYNRVTVNDDLDGSVLGGISIDENDSINNTVTINGGTVSMYAFGGYSLVGSVDNNSVTINYGTMERETFGGRSSAGSVNYNRVIINGGTARTVFGGSSQGNNTTNNTVTINGGTVRNVLGGSSQRGNAINNTVIINGGVVSNIFGGSSERGNAINNTVIINGGRAGRSVQGGRVFRHDRRGVDGDATNNTVTISGSPNLYNSIILGGSAYTGDAVTGNTLNVVRYEGSAVAGISNFEKYNFILQNGITDGATVLEVTGTLDLTGLSEITIWVDSSFDASALNAINLIAAGEINGSIPAITTNGWEVSIVGNNLVAKLNGTPAAWQDKTSSLIHTREVIGETLSSLR